MANKNKITILNEKEKELLRKANNVNAYDIYFHLKDDENYFQGEFYDLTRCMADYLNMSYDMVKRGLKKLKDVGLVETTKRGKVNIYKLPYNKKFSIKGNNRDEKTDDSQNKPIVYKEDERKPDIQTEQPIITPKYEDVEKSIEEATVSEVKTPSVPIKEEKKEDDFQKDVEDAVNELTEIALYEKGKEVFNEVLKKHSNNLSIQYNKSYDDVEEQLRNMSRKKYINLIDLKEVG